MISHVFTVHNAEKEDIWAFSASSEDNFFFGEKGGRMASLNYANHYDVCVVTVVKRAMYFHFN